MANACTALIIYYAPKNPIQFIREEVEKAARNELKVFLDNLWEQNKQHLNAFMERVSLEDPNEGLSLFGRVVQKKAYKGEEIAEALQAEAVFSLATDKKPIVATSGCYPCIAVGGYEPIHKFAFIIHFAHVDEIKNSGIELLNKISKLAKGPIQIHLRGGIEGQSEYLLKAIKIWLKIQPEINMSIASEETILKIEESGRSLLIDSRNGNIDNYDDSQNPLAKNPFKECPFFDKITVSYFPS